MNDDATATCREQHEEPDWAASWEPRDGYPNGDDQPDLAGRRLRHWASSAFDSHVGLAQQVKACAHVILRERDDLLVALAVHSGALEPWDLTDDQKAAVTRALKRVAGRLAPLTVAEPADTDPTGTQGT